MKIYGLGFYSIGREGCKQRINVMSFDSPTKSFLNAQSNGRWYSVVVGRLANKAVEILQVRWLGSSVLAGPQENPPHLITAPSCHIFTCLTGIK